MDDESIISRGLLCVREGLLSDLYSGKDPDIRGSVDEMERACLYILFSDDTGIGDSAFPSQWKLAKSIRKAGYTCRWKWWNTEGPVHVIAFPNRHYTLIPPEDGYLARVSIGTEMPYGRSAEIAVEAEDFVTLLEHFDAEIIARIPAAVKRYVFTLEKEIAAMRIMRVASLARSPANGSC